ncbi:MAG TPA: SCO2524 family protein [Pseudonocardiaceae bacterium]
MKLQPRQQVLEIWRATTHASYQGSKWLWGGRDGSNSISDAEQLLCLMTPAADVPVFRLDRPDETADDVLHALRDLGDSVEIPRLLVRILTEYMERYSGADGTPIFSGDGYFGPPSRQFATAGPTAPGPGQEFVLGDHLRRLDVVDSFSTSVALSLATIGFVRVFKEIIKREDARREVERLEELASRRLTAAMVGLLRSFTVSVFDAGSPYGRALCRTANQSGLPERTVVEELRATLRDINARLHDVTIGSGAGIAESLDNPNRLFECGWSWGIVQDAPEIEVPEDIGVQPRGVAQAAPYLYFTVVALDAIAELFSDRTRLLGLLNEHQSRLAQALQLRWDLTQTYWSRIATFGSGRWPLEDIPWRTTDRVESDYFSLLVTSIVVQDLVERRAPDASLNRVGQVLVELANRARITRRPFEEDDRQVAMHAPGVRIDLLSGDSDVAEFSWVVTDFSPLLLKRTMRIAGLMRDTTLRSDLLDLADRVWEHLQRRRMGSEPELALWDEPANVFDLAHAARREVTDGPSWYFSRRVVECLVTAADVVTSPPLGSHRLAELAADLLSEAEHRFDQEQLRGSTEAGPSIRLALGRARSTLHRARDIAADYPGTAFVLISQVLRELDQLAAARSDLAGET